MEVIMKRALLLLILISILSSFKIEKPKVLLFIQDNSADIGYMLTNEAAKIKDMLEQSGFEVITASLSGETLKTDQITLKPDLKLSNVNTGDYSGFIMPCMASNDTIVTPAEINFVKKIVNEGKPIAAQNGAVLILAKAGVLNGKKYALETGMSDLFPEFKRAIYTGTGVVQDGNIITSGTCPYMARETGRKDGTTELTEKLSQAIKAKI